MVIFKLVSFKVLVVTPIYTTISGGPLAILNSVWSIIVMYSACCRRPGEAPKRTKMTPRFSPAEKGEREAQRIERRAWVARLFLPQLITKGRGWGARVFLPQLIYPPPTPPPSPPPLYVLRVLCFALPVLHIKGYIYLLHDCSNFCRKLFL